MKCKNCQYLENNAENTIKCIITEEIRPTNSECNCEYTRSLYEKRKRLAKEYNIIKERIAVDLPSVTCVVCGDVLTEELGTTRVCSACKEAMNAVKQIVHDDESVFVIAPTDPTAATDSQ